MSEQLIPKRGDRVRLVHANGDEATVTVVAAGTVLVESRTFIFRYGAGWSVAEILEKPLPPEGTFVKGIDGDGCEWRGIAMRDHFIGGYKYHEDWYSGSEPFGHFKSWEVVK